MDWLLVIAESAPQKGFSSFWYWVFLGLFFVLGFLVGALIWRRMGSEAAFLEHENRRLLAAFQKRERSYQENRENVSSVLGQDALNRR